LIDIFDYLSSEKYQVVLENDDFKIFYVENAMLNQEKFISVINKTEQTTVFLHTRDQKREIGRFEKKSYAIGLVIVLCYKHFEIENESNFEIDELKVAVKSLDFDKIVELISKDCRQEYFSILDYKDNAICMVKNEDSYDVYYNYRSTKKEILQEASLLRASIVTRNYAKLLLIFNELFYKITVGLSLDNELYETYIECYLF
jgi:hypothetical protein